MSVSRKKLVMSSLAVLVVFLFVLEFIPQFATAAATRGSSIGSGLDETFTFFESAGIFLTKIIGNQYTRALSFIILITVFFTQGIRLLLSYIAKDSLSEEQKKMISGITITLAIMLSLFYLGTSGFGAYNGGNAKLNFTNIPASADRAIAQFGTGFWQFGIPILVAFLFVGMPSKDGEKGSFTKKLGWAMLVFGILTILIQFKIRLGSTTLGFISIIFGIIFLLIGNAGGFLNGVGGGAGSGFANKAGSVLGAFRDGFKNHGKSEGASGLVNDVDKELHQTQDESNKEANKETGVGLSLKKETDHLNTEEEENKQILDELNKLSGVINQLDGNQPPENLLQSLKPIKAEFERLDKLANKQVHLESLDKKLDRVINRSVFRKLKTEIEHEEEKIKDAIDNLKKASTLDSDEQNKINITLGRLNEELQFLEQEKNLVVGSSEMGGATSASIGSFIESNKITRQKLIRFNDEKRSTFEKLIKSILELIKEAENTILEEKKNELDANEPLFRFGKRVQDWKVAVTNDLRRLVYVISQMSDSYRNLRTNYNGAERYNLNVMDLQTRRKNAMNDILAQISNIHSDEDKATEAVQSFEHDITEQMNVVNEEISKLKSLFKKLVSTFLENTADFENASPSSFAAVTNQLLERITQVKYKLEYKKKEGPDADLVAFIDSQLSVLKELYDKTVSQQNEVIYANKVRSEIFGPVKTLQNITDLENRRKDDRDKLALWANDQTVITKIINEQLQFAITYFKGLNSSEFVTLLAEKIKVLSKEFKLNGPQLKPQDPVAPAPKSPVTLPPSN